MNWNFKPKPLRFFLIVLSIILTCGCSRLPETRVQRALYSDLYQVVRTRERTGWLMDKSELNKALPDAFQSICQVKPSERRLLSEWLQQQIKADGGSVKDAYEKANRSLDGLSDRLRLERIASLLTLADQTAESDCPFWLHPKDDFDAVQSDAGRFVLLVGSMGGLGLFIRDGKMSLGGGGGGRVIPAYGIGQNVTIGLGLEAGGQGDFTSDEGGQGRQVAARLIAGAPFLIRFHQLTQTYDLEITPIVRVKDDGASWPPGIRVAVGIGIKTIRVAGVLPIGGGWLGYEYLPKESGFPATHIIRLGTSVGIDWDP